MPHKRWLVIIGIAVAFAAVASPAFAYDEIPPTNNNCIECHGYDSPGANYETFGPHSNYLTTTRKCQACHSVHDAPAGGILLLPASTIKDTCGTCHDGSGGGGVYGVVYARTGQAATSEHSIGATDDVPGGATSGDWAYDVDFSDADGYLTCTDCHSPHGSGIVAAFTGDRARSAQYKPGVEPIVESARLLKQRPTSYTGVNPITEYGSDWCGACHVGRLSGVGMPYNHPVESTINPPKVDATGYNYETVARLGGGTGLGQSNLGYKMADPAPGGHRPICQQCHEDTRDVGAPADTTDTFEIDQVDGLEAGNNPRFQVFPHESQTSALLVSDWTDSSFCLSCHLPANLP